MYHEVFKAGNFCVYYQSFNLLANFCGSEATSLVCYKVFVIAKNLRLIIINKN